MEVETAAGPDSDSSKLKALSIKEMVEAANYAIKIRGANPEDEDVRDIIGEVYAG